MADINNCSYVTDNVETLSSQDSALYLGQCEYSLVAEGGMSVCILVFWMLLLGGKTTALVGRRLRKTTPILDGSKGSQSFIRACCFNQYVLSTCCLPDTVTMYHPGTDGVRVVIRRHHRA